MLAVHLEGGAVTVKRRPAPKRKPGYALVRVLVAGLCNTDLELRRGYYGFRGTPGHEFTGEVEEADTRQLVGKRVAGEINLACGACEYCARGLGRHCPRRTVLGIVKYPGAFAGYVTLPEENLHVIPAGMAVEEAVFVEPLAAACEILDQVKIARGARVAVLGDGKLGILIAQALGAHGAEVVHFGRHRAKLKLGGAVEQRIAGTRRPSMAFETVVESTGSAQGLREAVAMTKPRGTLVMKSTVHGLVSLDTAPVIVHEITLVGSRCGRFEPALRLLKSGRVNVRPMVHDEFPLAEAGRAFDRAAERGVLKVLLRP
ncbi:MAG: alcohol dehydrogenase catalytic domain-containing protein [Bryobacterales bacterium]|nr:alcohol dehydrogenase catalytic domain-containing protein [Bryobacterales bacterium]